MPGEYKPRHGRAAYTFTPAMVMWDGCEHAMSAMIVCPAQNPPADAEVAVGFAHEVILNFN
jgi:hypothetical protein